MKDEKPKIKVLCSECFDQQGCERVMSMTPQTHCEQCGRLCLGYETEIVNELETFVN